MLEGSEVDAVNKGLENSAGDLKTWITDVLSKKSTGHVETVGEFGQNCRKYNLCV